SGTFASVSASDIRRPLPCNGEAAALTIPSSRRRPIGAKLTRLSLLHAKRVEGGRRRRTGGVSPRDGPLSFCHAERMEYPCQDQSRGTTPPVALARATLPAQARWRED